ncbi:MAG: hypothetical protein HY731_02790, partial [Candidatus Tectomicrobia bacterium]|nr:hypothetical protein [Candidatus Tectomicrobia bacterium]
GFSSKGTMRHHVAIFQLPDWTLVKVFAETPPLEIFPRMLLRPDGQRLLLYYYYYEPQPESSDKISVSVITLYDTSSFQVTERHERRLLAKDDQQPGEIGDVYVGPSAYFGMDGVTIYDGLRILKEGRVTKVIDPFALLTETHRQQLQAVEWVNPQTGERFLPCCKVINGAAGKALLLIGPLYPRPDHSKVALLTYDFTVNQLSPLIFPPSHVALGSGWFPNVRLTPDGRHILLEVHDWRPRMRSELEKQNGEWKSIDVEVTDAYKTGEFILYEVASGQEIRRIQKPELAGFFSEIIRIAPDSSFMYYSKEHRLYAVNLLNPEAPVIRVGPEDLEADWSVIFADR